MASPQADTDLSGNQGPGIVVANLIVAALAGVAVILRYCARRVQGLSLQADDYLIFLALPFGWAMCVCTIIAVHNGLGKHLATLSPSLLATEGKAFYSSEIIWATSIPIIKISILLLYVRIFGRLRYMRITAWVIGIFSICWGIMVILVCALQCRPVQYTWDKSIQGTCINAPLFFIIGSAPNVFTDFVILALPLHAVWNLQTTKFQKVSLLCIFSLGSLTCVISLVRFIELIQNKDPDATWALGYVAIWSTSEPCLGILSASLPTLRPLVLKFWPGRNVNSSGSGKPRRPDYWIRSSSNKVGSNRSGSFNKLQDPIAGYPGIHTQVTTGEVEGSDEHLQSPNIPLNVIAVETRTSWANGSQRG